jgi:hypothetical protein
MSFCDQVPIVKHHHFIWSESLSLAEQKGILLNCLESSEEYVYMFKITTSSLFYVLPRHSLPPDMSYLTNLLIAYLRPLKCKLLKNVVCFIYCWILKTVPGIQ